MVVNLALGLAAVWARYAYSEAYKADAYSRGDLARLALDSLEQDIYEISLAETVAAFALFLEYETWIKAQAALLPDE